MNHTEVVSLEYATFVFNEIMASQHIDHEPFQIVWDTSFGLATAQTVSYKASRSPILKIKIGIESIDIETSRPELDNYDIFSEVRHAVFDYFKSDYEYLHMSLANHPDLLLKQLLIISKVELTEQLIIPNYFTVWNFSSIDGSINLPFIDGSTIEIKSPISLISKN